jgi:hypothetical protein
MSEVIVGRVPNLLRYRSVHIHRYSEQTSALHLRHPANNYRGWGNNRSERTQRPGDVITRKAKQSLPLKKNRLLSFAHMEKIIEKSAIPAEAGIREDLRLTLDSRLHGNDLEARVGHA